MGNRGEGPGVLSWDEDIEEESAGVLLPVNLDVVPLLEMVDREVVNHNAFLVVPEDVEFLHQEVENDLLLLDVPEGFVVLLVKLSVGGEETTLLVVNSQLEPLGHRA